MGPKGWDQFEGCGNLADEPASIKCLEAVFANIISAMVALVGVALFVMLMYGGFVYLTAGADAEKAKKARSTMTWAIVGVVVMISSYIILVLLEQFLGIELTRFTIPTFDSTL